MDEPIDVPPPHAWDEEETIFTEDDDLTAPGLDVPDDALISPAADAGLDMLVKAAEETTDG